MQASAKIHVMHDQPLMRAGLAALLQSPTWRVSIHCAQAEAMAEADMLVADYETGLQIAQASARGSPGQRILLVTWRDKLWEVRRALESGVAGYVLANADAAELQRGARHILDGFSYLSPAIARRIGECMGQEHLTNREQDVLELLAKGLCNKRIARNLGIEVGTVKWHVRGLMSKLDANARTQVVVTAAQRGLIGIDTPALARSAA